MMKKILLLGLCFSAGIGAASAQGSYGNQIGHTYYDLQTNASSGNRLVRNADGSISATWTELCTNDPAMANRGAGYNYYDPTSATWIEGIDGTCGDPYGVASKRVGWPEIVVLPNNNEVIYTHSGGGINVTRRPTKGTGGLAAWTSTTDLAFTQNITSVNLPGGGTMQVGGAAGTNGTWPRAVNSGNTIHLIYTLSNGSTTDPAKVNNVTSPFVYSRSLDGGQTWDMQNVFLPLDSATINSIGGDGYAIHSNGSTVAIVAGFFDDITTLWKSSDNGSTWTTKTIRKFTPAQDTMATFGPDTAVVWTTDAAHSILVDNNGTVHTWAGELIAQALKTPGTPIDSFKLSGSYYPVGLGLNNGGVFGANGIRYWNDAIPNMRPVQIAALEDIFPANDPRKFVGDGSYTTPRAWVPYGTKGLLSMPNAALGADGNVYLIYSGVVEGTSNNGSTITDGGSEGQSYRDLYIMEGEVRNTGVVWSDAINIASDLETIPGDTLGTSFEEDVYPSVAKFIGSNNKINVIWQVDYEPGLHVNSDLDPMTQNFIMHWDKDVTTIPWVDAIAIGVKEELAAYVHGISAYPNPTSDNVTIQIDLKKSSNVSVKVMNMMGQVVKTVPAQQLIEGKNKVSVDLSGLATGVYLYTVEGDNFTTTQRIVKQ